MNASTMRGIAITQSGGPEVLQAQDFEIPEPAQGQVLIRVMASGVNRPDVLQRLGAYPPPKGASPLPGLEVAGEIVSIADDVTDFAVGDLVCALLGGGGYADHCVADARLCLPWPKGYTAQMAAALPETVFTVWTNLFDGGKLQRTDRLLVHGGSSGIGTIAIQIAKAFDVSVATTVGNDDKAAFCRELGADLVINYREQDFAHEVQTWSDGKGVNVILDMVGGGYFANNMKVLAMEGRLVVIATQQGATAEIDLGQMMRNRQIITGSTLRPRTVAQKLAIAREVYINIWPLLELGTIKPIIHQEFALEDADKAHVMMESSQHIGKLILTTQYCA